MRGKGEGTIRKREGRFEARLTIGGTTPNGSPRRVGATFDTKRAAQAWLSAQRQQRDQGTLLEPHRTTVREWVASYLDSLDVRPNTEHDYRKALAPVLDDLGHLMLRDLTPARVQQQLGRWSKARTPYQNRKTMRALKACLGEATRLELLARNPAAPVRAPRLEPKQILVWTGEEAARALAHARKVEHRLYPYLHLNLTTGLRREEMLGLRWADLDLDGHQLHVRQTVTYIEGAAQFGPPKTAAGRRTLALDAGTVQVLRDWREAQGMLRAKKTEKGKWTEHDLVFSSERGTAAAESRLARTMRDLMAAAEVPVIRLYDLRHSYASIAYERGVPVKLIGERLGHTQIAFTLQTYVHSNDAQRRAAALSAEELFGSTPEKKDESPPLPDADAV